MPANDHMPLSEAVFQMLLSLVDGPMHGYGMIQDIERRTGGSVVLGSGTLYSAIKRMRRDAWVAEAEVEDPEDPRRRYYALTDVGRTVVRAEARRLDALVRQAYAKDLLADVSGGP